MKQRLTVLDSLRGIAALSVLLFHYTYSYNKLYGNFFIHDILHFRMGHYGVQFFFIISGFVIFMTINKVKNVTEFVKKRFLRLYPTYWICLIITSLVIILNGNRFSGISFKQFLINITMLQGLFKVKNIDGAYWSLLPELLFYLMMCFVIQLRLQKRIVLFCFIWSILMIINFIRPTFLEILLNLKFGVYFIIGIMFFRIYSKQNTNYEYLLILLSWVLSLFIFEGRENAIVLTFAIVSFYLFVKHKLTFLDNSFLIFLGNISYPLYLIHGVLGFILIENLKNVVNNNYLLLMIVITIVSLLSVIIYRGFEKRILSKITKKVL